MGKKASEAVNDPVVKTVAAGAAGFVVAGPVGAAVAAGAVAGNESFKEQEGRQKDAIEELKGLKQTSKTDSTRTDTQEIDQTQTSQTTFDPKSAQESQLLDASVDNFSQQQRLVNAQEQDLQRLGALENQSRGVLGDINSGDAFNVSSSEQARINNLRDSNIEASRFAVDDLLNERLAEVEADAARRGIRGQAFTQLQGDAIATGAKNLNQASLEANRIASQQAIDLPGQRVATQANVAGGLVNVQEQQRQQAINNRQLLQDPAALRQLRDERLRGGKTTASNTGTTTNTTTDSVSTEGTGQGVAAAIAARGQSPGRFGSILGTTLEAAGVGARFAGAGGGGGGG